MSEHDFKQTFTRRVAILGTLKGVLLGGLLCRLYGLQIQSHAHYQLLSDKNRLQCLMILPIRGIIVDKKGVEIASTKTAYSAIIIKGQTTNFRNLLKDAGGILQLDNDTIDKLALKSKKERSAHPLLLKDRLTWDEVARLNLHVNRLSGIRIQQNAARYYPFGSLTTPITGYVGTVSMDEKDGDPILSQPSYRIGKMGLEKVYENHLRGIPGTHNMEVNAVGKVMQELEGIPSIQGKTLKTTLDMELQKRIASSFEPHRSGCCIALNMHTGAIHALYSHPSYDANLFVEGIKKKDWDQLMTNPDQPLLNRVTHGLYAPGSLIKPILAYAALERKLITPTQTFFCPGHYNLGGHLFHCHTWSRGGCGTVNVTQAIERSCDVFFYHLALLGGVHFIEEAALKFGLGTETGVDLGGEKRGLVPQASWKKKVHGRSWTTGDSLNVSIGQGYFLCTPIQATVALARLINGGKIIHPRLVLENNMCHEQTVLDPTCRKYVLDGMDAVCNSPFGTANHLKHPDRSFQIGGKTATSQVRRLSMKDRKEGRTKAAHFDWQFRDHAWFAGYAPVDDPKYICVALVEHGGSGGKIASPIVNDTLQYLMRQV